ncbi:MAG TPA: hypothetical protein VEL70_06675 [Candidatus Acidoferrum sp.]|nr:hypothetical protein [Candidatus Acidoferrum sp.]
MLNYLIIYHRLSPSVFDAAAATTPVKGGAPISTSDADTSGGAPIATACYLN